MLLRLLRRRCCHLDTCSLADHREHSIVSICLSRFMFHLREVYLATCSPSELETTRLSRIISGRNANRIVGNLGAALDFSRSEDATIRCRAIRIPTWRDEIIEESRTPHISHDPLWDSLAVEVEPGPNRPNTTYLECRPLII